MAGFDLTMTAPKQPSSVPKSHPLSGCWGAHRVLAKRLQDRLPLRVGDLQVDGLGVARRTAVRAPDLLVLGQFLLRMASTPYTGRASIGGGGVNQFCRPSNGGNFVHGPHTFFLIICPTQGSTSPSQFFWQQFSPPKRLKTGAMIARPGGNLKMGPRGDYNLEGTQALQAPAPAVLYQTRMKGSGHTMKHLWLLAGRSKVRDEQRAAPANRTVASSRMEGSPTAGDNENPPNAK